MIEREHEENGGRPVVLLAHSMGNNMAHYFLNWVQQHGQSAKAIHGPASAWLEKHGECGVRSTHWPL
jgi:alpha-beta hydrolase superfamily lysophospholipase